MALQRLRCQPAVGNSDELVLDLSFQINKAYICQFDTPVLVDQQTSRRQVLVADRVVHAVQVRQPLGRTNQQAEQRIPLEQNRLIQDCSFQSTFGDILVHDTKVVLLLVSAHEDDDVRVSNVGASLQDIPSSFLMLLHIGQHTFLEGHFFATEVAIVQLLVDRHHLAFHDVSTFVHNLVENFTFAGEGDAVLPVRQVNREVFFLFYWPWHIDFAFAHWHMVDQRRFFHESFQHFQHQRETRATFRIGVPALFHELCILLRALLRDVRAQIVSDNFDNQLRWGEPGATIRDLTSVQLPEDDTERVDIRLVSVGFVLDHFGGHPQGRTTLSHGAFFGKTRHSKICNLGFPVLVHQNVERLEISVQNGGRLHGMKIRHTSCNISCNGKGLGPCETTALVSDDVKKRATRHNFSDNAEVGMFQTHTHEKGKARVPKSAHDLCLLAKLFDDVRRHETGVNFFDSYFTFSPGPSKHFTLTSFPKKLPQS
mmetsp:Transcript_4623/g.8856  ORF Transcript_4623/g.8856 Transcript_4623/m.8856 type:complete len:483 (-) Transcript_4623:204-1652(-)